MNDLFPQVDFWVKAALAVLASVGSFLYVSSGFMKEFWAYKARTLELNSLAKDTARNIPQGALGDVVGISLLADKLDAILIELKKIRTDRETAAEEKMAERLSAAIAAIERLEHRR